MQHAASDAVEGEDEGEERKPGVLYSISAMATV